MSKLKHYVDRFLTWPLPKSVCSDLCATMRDYPHRTGTTLLTATEAEEMFKHVLETEVPEDERLLRHWYEDRDFPEVKDGNDGVLGYVPNPADRKRLIERHNKLVDYVLENFTPKKLTPLPINPALLAELPPEEEEDDFAAICKRFFTDPLNCQWFDKLFDELEINLSQARKWCSGVSEPHPRMKKIVLEKIAALKGKVDHSNGD
ncbi:MAG: hypothetical protein OIN85_00795 [Candidatus Methanoperedens sp.]|nr:hypothetical protein [Candidatus Methanoperedens sp.]